jgi:hypothetical protein
MEIKRNLFRDVLRDTNSRKYSMTKLAAFTSLILLIIAVGSAIGIMIITQDIDHILIGELIALLLTLLGFKNFRGNFKSLDKGDSKKTEKPQKIETDELKPEERDELG